MQHIEEKAYETYQKNIEYFSKEQKGVLKLLTIFDGALHNGGFEPTLDLEYKEGYFDVKDTTSQKYLYGGDANEISKQLKERVTLDKNSNIFEGIPIYNIPKELHSNEDEGYQSISGVLGMMHYYANNTSSERQTMLHLDKLIVIGTGLGLHIPMLFEEFAPKVCIIIEDNLELFKLSLFTTEYAALAKETRLYFSIADDENLFLQTFGAFLEDAFFYNRYLKYSLFPSHSHEKIKQIQNALMTQSFIFFPYKAALFKYLKPLEYMNDGYNLFSLSKDFSDSLFSTKPMLVLAAGPSLIENIEWLKQNHTRFIIIAISTILNTLYKHGIKPDIVTQLDGGETSLKFYEDALAANFLENVPMLFGPNIPKKVRDLFAKEQIYYYDEGEGYISASMPLSSPCIGSLSTTLGLYLGAKELYLLGVNLAVDQETGQSHTADYAYGYQTDTENKDKLANVMEHQKNLFLVKGNFRETVYTNSIMHASVQSLFRNIPNIKKAYQKIYNLSDGSYINGTIPMHANEIATQTLPPLDKTMLNRLIKETLTAHSILTLCKEDIVQIKERLADAKETQKRLEAYMQSVSHANKEQYLYDLLGLMSYILHKQKPSSINATSVFLLFFKYALTMILDFFNTKGLKNAKRHIKKFDALIQKEMQSILTIYIQDLEKFIQERC